MTARAVALLLGLVALLTGSLAVAPSASAAPPANDDRADAQVTGGWDGSAPGTTVDATPGPDEYRDGGVWFTWTAPADGLVCARPASPAASSAASDRTG